MEYTFEILGISPVLHFFNQQQEIARKVPRRNVEYIGTHKCTLDALLTSVEVVLPNQGWEFEPIAETVIHFWMSNSDSIGYWKARLKDAGSENLLVSRLADFKSLQAEFESLLGKNF